MLNGVMILLVAFEQTSRLHEKIELAFHDVPIMFDIFLSSVLICENEVVFLFVVGLFFFAILKILVT